MEPSWLIQAFSLHLCRLQQRVRMRVLESQLSAKFSPISQLSTKFLSSAGLVDGKDSKNTQLVTKTALTTFRAFCEDFQRRTTWTPRRLLSEWKEKSGGHYKKSALSSIRFGLQWHFMLKREFNIISDLLLNSQTKSLKPSWLNLNDRGSQKLNIMNQYWQRTWRKSIRHMIRHLQKVSGVLRLVQHNVSPYSPREREPSPSQETVVFC